MNDKEKDNYEKSLKNPEIEKYSKNHIYTDRRKNKIKAIRRIFILLFPICILILIIFSCIFWIS